MSALAHGISGGAGNQRRLMGGAINEMEIYCSDLYTVEFVLEEIAKAKTPDLTAADMDAAVRTIAGSARAMGLDVEGV